ncbi:hypothetical protein BC829DRAFT_391390 [Chytridium lagenaria]|nr:hypothetical protein BC829DRAFT_391390 [Chytridium lagenaria]
MERPELRKDGVDIIYRVSTFAAARELLERFGVKTTVKEPQESATLKDSFFKYPRTRHLIDLGELLVLAILQPHPTLGDVTVTVEEKIDGANLGFRLVWDESKYSFEVVAQNRAHDRITADTHVQFKGLGGWIQNHRDALERILRGVEDGGDVSDGPGRFVIFGEWMRAKHSVAYDRLPDLFIAFDLYDTQALKFLSRQDLPQFLRNSGIAHVPVIELDLARKDPKESVLEALQGISAFSTSERREGVVVRVDKGDWLLEKCKVVRKDFLAGNRHWMKNKVELNGVVRD